MARDEALLRTAADRPWPLLRVYAWQEPAVSIGYFMQYPSHLADRYAIVRRPTGGGIVYHDADTTYTVVVPPGHPLHKLSTEDAYRRIHEAVAASLNRKSKIENRKPLSSRASYECFQEPVPGDVMAGDRKLAGAAQRRSKLGMLHQGSIAGRVPVARLTGAFTAVLAAAFEPYQLTPAETALAAELARDKYATVTWTKRYA